MTIEITLLIIAFVGGMTTLLRENQNKRPHDSPILGLTRLGIFLTALCIIGFIFSAAKLSQDQKEKFTAEQNNKAMSDDIKKVIARLDGLPKDLRNSLAGAMLEELSGNLQEALGNNTLASKNPNNLTYADFTSNNLTKANFRKAILHGANFQSADFSNAILLDANLREAQIDPSTLATICPTPVITSPPSLPTNKEQIETLPNEGIVVIENPESTVEDRTPQVATPPDPLGSDGDLTPPRFIYGSQPKYTKIAKKARIQGIVELEIVVDKQGNVKDVKITKDLAMGLGEEAARTVKKWKYEPATKNGEPVAVHLDLSIGFSLQ